MDLLLASDMKIKKQSFNAAAHLEQWLYILHNQNKMFQQQKPNENLTVCCWYHHAVYFTFLASREEFKIKETQGADTHTPAFFSSR